MEFTFVNRLFKARSRSVDNTSAEEKNLSTSKVNETSVIRGIRTEDEEMQKFLFTLGCYEGEEITLISRLADNYVVHIKGARYSIDQELAKSILL
ncbi:ferrous iron transport protein A [Proteiniclasticum sp. C24MP]|uniref:FeoA family protein n=1 Tax=Proteiniclasticum sp. C24MP TaxID=3374101 RepID=UPI003754E5F4